MQKYWRYTEFKGLQWSIIEAAVNGQDVVGVMPTGGGKSICYQMAGLLRGGLTVIVSPLIALMKDQADSLNARGLHATMVNSELPWHEIEQRLLLCQRRQFQFLYLAPERLTTELLLKRIDRMDIRLLAVDEAHCISHWGHQFRPAYRQINRFRKLLRNVPCMAVTATATPTVLEDIRVQLSMPEHAPILVQGFGRPNLGLAVVYDAENKAERMVEFLRRIPGSVIVYLRNRHETETLAGYFRRAGFTAVAYHAGMPAVLRTQAQDDWQANRVRIIVATNAFGMGVDKPDVRLIIHAEPPPDLESYYQEAGRAGRDGKPAWAVTFYTSSDRETLERQNRTFHPNWEELNRVYGFICEICRVNRYTPPVDIYPVDLTGWGQALKLSPGLIEACLRLLADGGYIQQIRLGEGGHYLKFLTSFDGLYRAAERMPQHEPVIEDFIRHCGATASTTPTLINLRSHAQRLGIGSQKVQQTLEHLHTLQLVSYEIREAQTGIKFLQPASTLSRDLLHWKLQEELYTESQKRLETVVRFLANTTDCRQQLLLNYFKDYGSTRCGICDNCRGKHRAAQAVKPLEVSSIKQATEHLLRQAPTDWATLTKRLSGQFPGLEIEPVLQSLIEQGRIEITADFELGWVG